jgi:hypothetical protein
MQIPVDFKTLIPWDSLGYQLALFLTEKIYSGKKPNPTIWLFSNHSITFNPTSLL